MKYSKELLQARKMLAAINSNMVRLGTLLEEHRLTKSYLTHGYASFRDFCSDIPIHYRKAMNLIEIANAVEKKLLTEFEVLEIGWSKACLIAGVMTRKAAVRALTVARRSSLQELRLFLKTGGISKGRISKVFVLTVSESNDLERALVGYGATIKSGRIQGREEALMRMVRKLS